MKSYSQIRAMFAITRASLSALVRSPSAVVFGFAFPFVFILVFGFIGNSGLSKIYKVAVDKNADTSNVLYKKLQQTKEISLVDFKDESSLNDDFQKGRIAGIINIQKNASGTPPYVVSFKSTTSSNDQWPQVKSIIESVVTSVSNNVYTDRPVFAEFDFDYKKDITVIRQYKTIDFILPGQLGFSLLASGVFGVAFTFLA